MASEHYPGCWRKHKQCAVNTVQYEQTRADFAVDRAREAEALVKRLEGMMLDILRWSAWQVRLNDWRKHSVTAVGTQPTPQDACREIGALARQALHEIGTTAEGGGDGE